MTALDTVIATLTENVFNSVAEDGGVRVPVWLLETDADELIAITTPIDQDTDRDMIAVAMRMLLKEKKAVRYAFAMEAWFALDSQEAPLPSKRPDRQECIFVSGEDRNGEKQSLMHEIDRSSGAVTLKPPKRIDAAFGRFSNLLSTKQ
jgi:hypothetical protein